MKKIFVAQLDISIIEFLPQKIQLDIIKSSLDFNSIISIHSIENLETRDQFFSLKNILKNSKNLNGIIFFSLMQFCYNKKAEIDLKNIEFFLKKYELIFFRENMSLKNVKDFNKYKNTLKLFKLNNNSLLSKFY